jgi:hypothetical protein
MMMEVPDNLVAVDEAIAEFLDSRLWDLRDG